MEISRKISGSTLTAGINIKSSKARRYLGRIYGIATSTEQVETAFGVPASKFIGEFVAHRADGKTATAPVAYLPPACIPTVEEALIEFGPTKFAFDFFVQTEAGVVRWFFTTLELSAADSPLAFASVLPRVEDVAHPAAKPETNTNVTVKSVEPQAKAKPKLRAAK